MKLLLLAAVFMIACAPGVSTVRVPSTGHLRPTLLIVNTGVDNLRVTNEYGHTLARVYAGERVCIELINDNRQRLHFKQPYKLVVGPEFSPYTNAGWVVEIGNSLVHDVFSLEPAERCK